MFITDLIGEATEYDKKQALEKKKPKSWCKSVSAFANGIGGSLIFGISDDDKIIGLTDAEHDAEIISEQIKERLNPIPNFNLRFYKNEDDKKLIILDIYSGDQTPYYYEADGSLMAYYRLGNQSVPVTPAKLKELVLKGSVSSYDSLKSKYKFDNMSFTKLKSTYKIRTGLQFDDSDYESFGITDEKGNLTNAGALKTQQQYDLILAYMDKGKEYGIKDFCKLLNLKETRTKVILNGLIENREIETVGAKRDRKYILSKN